MNEGEEENERKKRKDNSFVEWTRRRRIKQEWNNGRK
jgi:hypothetical protein